MGDEKTIFESVMERQKRQCLEIRERKRLAEEEANRPPKPRGRPKGSKNKNPLDGLPPRKQKYLQGVADGLTKYDAALAAGYSQSVARNASLKIETGDAKLAFRELLRETIKPEKIARRLNEGLDSTKVIYAQMEGRITDTKQVPDFAERRKAAELTAQMTDFWNPKQETTITNAIDESTARRLTELIENLNLLSLPPGQLVSLRKSHVALQDQAPVIDAEIIPIEENK